ncbi:hypothetical protein B0A48_13813 [Cryoendolithus antarcticus]|uniref:Uncharacterized protein n=1 Tax=Cryoendolithus antarcticus TaxID=1507870 RepID=A0A1V8SN11_9PEZI|nr:hypothetical protein B0A48_13813 [Cryoendolithus antarcticus]
MAEMFYFSGASVPSAAVKCRKVSLSRRRLLAKRICSGDRMERLTVSERACMARFITEPVFCESGVLPFALNSWQDESFSEDDDEEGGVLLDDESDGSGTGALSSPTLDDSIYLDDAGFATPALSTSSLAEYDDAALPELVASDHDSLPSSPSCQISLTLRQRHPRPECEETTREEDARRQRFALPGDGSDEVPRFDEALGRVFDTRGLLNHRSCDNLRSPDRYQSRLPSIRVRSHSLAVIPNSAPVPSQVPPVPIIEPHIRSSEADAPAFAPLDTPGEDNLLDILDADRVVLDVNDQRHSYDFADFIDDWEYDNAHSANPANAPGAIRDALRPRTDPSVYHDITRHDFKAGQGDLQGIPWHETTTTRAQAMDQRRQLHPSHSGRYLTELDMRPQLGGSAHEEQHYRFHRFNGRWKPSYSHFELRNVIASHGQDVFFSRGGRVHCTPLALPAESRVVIDLTRRSASAASMRVTCLATSQPTDLSYTSDSVLIAGGFYGEYALQSLGSAAPEVQEGYVTHNWNGLVTHIHTFPSRTSGALQAAFCSNDTRLRIMDIRTLKYTGTFSYANSLNCSATAPDGRLRLIGGDSRDALITNAETGATLVTVPNKDHVFACAWSPDSRHVATASQNGETLLWDSRNWSQPTASLPSVMSCVRSLHFTEDSALLVAAESEDVVSIYDVRNAEKERQELRFFGTVAGVALLDGGNEVVVGNGDRTVGGLLTWRRDAAGVLSRSSEGACGRRERMQCQARRRRRAWDGDDEVQVV